MAKVTLFSWGPGDDLVVTSGQIPQGVSETASPDERRRAVSRGADLSWIRLNLPWSLWKNRNFVQAPLQMFYSEAQNVWSQSISRALSVVVDAAKKNARRMLLADEINEYKELYCTLLTRMVENVENLQEGDAALAKDMLSRLYRGHQAWHLAHIIIKHLSPRPANMNADLPFDLVHWMQEHNPSDLFQGGSSQPFLTDGASYRANDDWWRALFHFVMHVYIDQAVEMLSLIGRDGPFAHQCGEDGVEMVEVMLSLLVGGGEGGEVSLFELENMVDNNVAIDSYWRVWTTRKEWTYLDKLVQRGASPICQKMATMVKIMKGSEDEISAHAYSWLQIVVTRMLYGRSETVLGVADLASYADDALTVHGQFVRKPEDEESVIKDLLRLDMQGAVQHFFTDLKDWWSSAHLADVLYRGKYLPFSQLFASNMRTYAICNYIDILMSSNNMWQVAMAYVKGVVESDAMVDESTSVEARERWRVRRQEMLHLAHLIISRQHIDSDIKCRHLLQCCPEYVRDIHGSHLWDDSEVTSNLFPDIPSLPLPSLPFPSSSLPLPFHSVLFSSLLASCLLFFSCPFCLTCRSVDRQDGK